MVLHVPPKHRANPSDVQSIVALTPAAQNVTELPVHVSAPFVGTHASP
jgi:hypothetical protein